MTDLLFHEKPGCVTNARQKELLRAWGNKLEVRDLTREAWTVDNLGKYFSGPPQASWLNPTAPALTNGGFTLSGKDRAAVLAAMIADPLLIRRPLIRCGEYYSFGFDPVALSACVKVGALDATLDVQTCSVKQPSKAEEYHEQLQRAT